MTMKRYCDLHFEKVLFFLPIVNILQHQLTDISIKANEEDMRKEWDIQFQNWATPVSLQKKCGTITQNKNYPSDSIKMFHKITIF
jgi:hypothetical protein